MLWKKKQQQQQQQDQQMKQEQVKSEHNSQPSGDESTSTTPLRSRNRNRQPLMPVSPTVIKSEINQLRTTPLTPLQRLKRFSPMKDETPISSSNKRARVTSLSDSIIIDLEEEDNGEDENPTTPPVSNNIKSRSQEQPCRVCHKLTDFKCSGCSMQYYCSRECQKSDWKRHKQQCNKTVSSTSNSNSSSIIIL
jgi:hypothetical protein